MNAVQVEGLGKRYVIGHQAQADTLRDAVAGGVTGLWRRLRRGAMKREAFWALQDVSFGIKPGEVVGIIGRNGAGKSTLLKLLSRITEPTTGRITLNGRVASLLEVGTGFHPELSGRENIYLNGAILGMSRAEIALKFDEIVAFAEIERFLDTPVKRYSSGMYVRLAFAVAAHLEPETLIIDEVLAVGDANFQKKCLGKIGQVASNGRTVLFVSHNIGMVNRLCTSAILLEKGKLSLRTDSVEQAVNRYIESGLGQSTDAAHLYVNDETTPGSKPVIVRRMEVMHQGPAQQQSPASPVHLAMELELSEEIPNLNLGLYLRNNEWETLSVVASSDGERDSWPILKPGRNRLEVSIPAVSLNLGTYFLEFVASIHNRDWIISPGSGPIVSFRVTELMSQSTRWVSRRAGLLAPLSEWTLTP
ncbi:polysaccharide ABC transporter ATP-binding protein [Actomonas aquatica]|uniref:Polysaccharide ABC transporter ATP-binding protein n=1 Tax=Actomonas aquatica TaxID=2866162 RepID=A0ABZ1C9T5_9BACT|nr:polysaccharide ABC transporter ATP-binding protein [Opitutus sp. WL0086]WRQ88454.1 polysaccharide ABC transporter ATP-binding protein [Opitutus sp. WL0086]